MITLKDDSSIKLKVTEKVDRTLIIGQEIDYGGIYFSKTGKVVKINVDDVKYISVIHKVTPERFQGRTFAGDFFAHIILWSAIALLFIIFPP